MPPLIAEPARAVLADLDGTLMDTEQAWLRAVAGWLREQGASHPKRLVARYRGESVSETFRFLLDALGVDPGDDAAVAAHRASFDAATDEVSRLELRGGGAWLPGARELVDAARAAGVPLALVTSSPRDWVAALAPALDLSLFDVVVTADDVSHPKPHPLPYLQAAAALGLPPTDCVVLEDSRPGVTAGLAAGCQVVAVAGRHGVPAGRRTVVLDSLAGLAIDDLTHGRVVTSSGTA